MSDQLEVGAYQAKTHLPDLLRKVRAGLRFTITQRSHAVADLVPVGTDALQSNAAAAGRMRQFMKRGGGTAYSDDCVTNAIESAQVIDMPGEAVESRSL